jgi:hypothetical protein
MEHLSKIQAEFERAAQVRAKGNEGQARVCARRAAGIAAREYFFQRGTRVPSASAYDLLNMLKDDSHLPAEFQTIVAHLTVRVTEEFKLPVDADLIAEAKTLCDWLLENK